MEQEIKKPYCEVGKHVSFCLYARWKGKMACNPCYQKARRKDPTKREMIRDWDRKYRSKMTKAAKKK